MMCSALKGPLCNLRTMQALISLRNRAGWSGPSMPLDRINDIVVYVDNSRISRSDCMNGMLIRTFAVCTCHKGLFPTLCIIWYIFSHCTSSNSHANFLQQFNPNRVYDYHKTERADLKAGSLTFNTTRSTIIVTLVAMTIASLTSCITACRRLAPRYFVRGLIIVGLIFTVWSVGCIRGWEMP